MDVITKFENWLGEERNAMCPREGREFWFREFLSRVQRLV